MSNEQTPRTTETPMMFERACLYVDGCGTPIGIGRSWAAARASAVNCSRMVDPHDPERCTPELAEAFAEAHWADGLEPCEILVRTERELQAVLLALGVNDPVRELGTPSDAVVRVGRATLRFEPAPHDPPNPGVVEETRDPHRAHLEEIAAGEGEQGRMPYQAELARWMLDGDPLERIERAADMISILAARVLAASWEARRGR